MPTLEWCSMTVSGVNLESRLITDHRHLSSQANFHWAGLPSDVDQIACINFSQVPVSGKRRAGRGNQLVIGRMKLPRKFHVACNEGMGPCSLKFSNVVGMGREGCRAARIAGHGASLDGMEFGRVTDLALVTGCPAVAATTAWSRTPPAWQGTRSRIPGLDWRRTH